MQTFTNNINIEETKVENQKYKLTQIKFFRGKIYISFI